ncbi:hypothetical protein [Streptomyces sp. TRM68367]|uniref:hypothetical protein n=1 Tax=Streptomyces sp. TRM68367 TaxID=2758415 RepID=UPI00165A8ADC|nr:hypothetical protein [Streptomyces sp. TRM68367]MBC9730126.1 hypothetical protein [Streptomyces sp. TRM68367]
MTTSADSTAIDQAKRPLLDGYDVVDIAEALRRSPHIRSVDDVSPGDKAVWFRDAGGTGYTLSLTDVEPIPEDGPQGEAYPWDAVAAAIGNHPDFVSAELVSKPIGLNLDTITAVTRTDFEYTLKLTAAFRPRADSAEEEPPASVDRILEAVGQLRSRSDDNPDAVVFDASAGLLEHIAGTWDQQDDQTRQRAVTLALALGL